MVINFDVSENQVRKKVKKKSGKEILIKVDHNIKNWKLFKKKKNQFEMVE